MENLDEANAEVRKDHKRERLSTCRLSAWGYRFLDSPRQSG